MLCKQCFSALQRKELSAPIYWLSAGNLLVLCIYMHLPRAPSGQRLQLSWLDGSCTLSDPCTREHFCSLIDGELDAGSKIFAAYSFRNHWLVAPRGSIWRKGSFGCRSFLRERNSLASTLLWPPLWKGCWKLAQVTFCQDTPKGCIMTPGSWWGQFFFFFFFYRKNFLRHWHTDSWPTWPVTPGDEILTNIKILARLELWRRVG